MIFRKLFSVFFDAADPTGGTGTQEPPALPEWVNSVFSEDTRKSEDFLKDMTAHKYQSPDDFWKSYKNAQDFIGKKRVAVPTDKSTPEEVNEFFNTIGRPGKPEEYKLALPEKLHPSIKITPEGQKGFFDFAHKNGFTNKQAQELNGWYLQDLSQKLYASEKAAEESRIAGETELRNEWGTNFDLHNAQAEKAWSVFSKGKDKDGKPIDLLDPESFKDPNVKRVFQIIGSKISEDTFKSMTTQAGGSGDQDAKSKIAAINNDPKHPYWVQDHPDHKAAVNEMLELQKKAG